MIKSFNLTITDAEKNTLQKHIDNALEENKKNKIPQQIFNPVFMEELRIRLRIEECLDGISDKKERAEKILFEVFKKFIEDW